MLLGKTNTKTTPEFQMGSHKVHMSQQRPIVSFFSTQFTSPKEKSRIEKLFI